MLTISVASFAGLKFRKLRKASGLGRSQLGYKVGLSGMTIWNIENGKWSIDCLAFKTLLHHFDLTYTAISTEYAQEILRVRLDAIRSQVSELCSTESAGVCAS